MLHQNSFQYTNVRPLLQIMLCTPPNISPVEKGYTSVYLQTFTAKWRNHLSNENIGTGNQTC